MESIIGDSTRRHDIVFYRTGRIDILSSITKALGIKEGDVIDISVDEGEYYLYVRAKSENVIGRHEAKCFSTKKSIKGQSRHLRAHSKTLTNAILSKYPDGIKYARIPAGSIVEEAPKIGKAIILITSANL